MSVAKEIIVANKCVRRLTTLMKDVGEQATLRPFGRGKQSPGAVNNGVIHTLKSSDRMNNSRVAVAWK